MLAAATCIARAKQVTQPGPGRASSLLGTCCRQQTDVSAVFAPLIVRTPNLCIQSPTGREKRHGLDPETRRNVRANWIDCLYHFASPRLQQLWVTGTDPATVVSFAECMCCYFDDIDMKQGLEPALKRDLLTAEEVQAVADFHSAAASYEAPSDNDSDVLNDPAWDRVVIAAQHAWNRLRAIISDESELARMARSERRWGQIPRAHSR